MTWTDAPQFYEGVDEDALKRRFVELSARYISEDAMSIGTEVLKGSCETLEALRISALWSSSLEIREAIRQYRINGDHPKPVPELPSKEQIALELLTIGRDAAVPEKDRIAAYKTHAEVMGYITKQVDKKVENKTPRAPPVIVFKKYEDNAS